MSTRVENPSWLPAVSWWGVAACVIAVGLVGSWPVAAGLTVLFLVNAFRPFDFVASFLLVTGASTFVYYSGGNMTLQLGLLSAAILLMLFCYFLWRQGRIFTMVTADLTWPLVAYLLLALANAARGFLVGHPIKHVLNETLPVLGVATALLVANGFESRRDLRLVVLSLVGIAFGSAALGYHVFAIIHTRTAGVFFHPVPGMVALLLVNLALRAKRLPTAFVWLGLSLPLFLHQFLSFRRGLWMGTLAGLILSFLTFSLGRGSRTRWARTGLLVGSLVGLSVVGALTMATIYGQSDILGEAGGRFASIGGTELSPETRSNVTRLVEYAAVIELIQKSPLVGYGLGYTFIVHNPLNGETRPQWWVHQNYMLVWLKQGAIGLGVFVWMLWAAARMGVRGARRRQDPWEASWLGATAAGTAFIAAFALVDFPFDQIEAMFLLALLWGGSMSIVRQGSTQFRWYPRRPEAVQGGVPEPLGTHGT